MSTIRATRSLLSLSRRLTTTTARQPIRQTSSKPTTSLPHSIRQPLSSPLSHRAFSSSPPSATTPTTPATGTLDISSAVTTSSARALSPPPPPHLSEVELRVYETLVDALEPTALDVQDISGGCGSMFGIEVASERFRGLSMLRQQRLVNQVLKPLMEAENWHGVQIRTKVE